MSKANDEGVVTSADPVTNKERTPRNPVEDARKAFNEYAGMAPPKLPDGDMAKLQVELCRWEAREFGGGSVNSSTLGVNEEVGELAEAMIMLLAAKVPAARMAQAVLKRQQGIRGFDSDETYHKAMGDAIADIIVFATQAATKLRMDVWTLLFETAHEVMEKREWSKHKFDGTSDG